MKKEKKNDEKERLNIFLLKVDKLILQEFKKDVVDINLVDQTMTVRERILDRINQIQKSENTRKMFE